MRRQVVILAISQAIFQTASVLVVAIGGLVGGAIASSPEWATVPIASMFLGTALVTFPAAGWMARVGRRAGFILGAILGCSGALVAAGGIWLNFLSLFALGTFFFGAYQAFAQFYRFAASEVSDDRFRPRAIALVLGGGIVAAFLGPELARLGGPMLKPAYLGSFLILALVSLLGAGVLAFLRMPDVKTDHPSPAPSRPWSQIVSQPAYLVALLAATTGYGVMTLAMTATPLAMVRHHHDLFATTTVIQLHVLGMFLPSFFTGALISRFGVLRVMVAGILLLGSHVLMTLTGIGFASFASALVLLGVGWNFLYIGGTTLLTATYSPAEKSRAQATNDLTILAVGLVCSLGAGWLLQTVGWQTLNVLMLPWLALTAFALIGFALKAGREKKAPTEGVVDGEKIHDFQ